MRSVILAAVALAVVWAGPVRADDQEVAQRVAKRLKESGQLAGYNIGIKYSGGTLWLRGDVSSPAQAAAATRLARQSPEVKNVVNRLTVKTAASSKVRRTAHNAPLPAGGRPSLVAMRQVEGEEAVEGMVEDGGMVGGGPMPMYPAGVGGSIAPAHYDQPHLPGYAWPSYAAYPNYAAVTYPRQYSPTAWPFIGPFYPYPQVPLGWRKVTLEWDDGWWMLDFQD